MTKIDTAYIKKYILSQYENGNKMKRITKRKFTYDNDEVTDTNLDGKVVLNGKLNWRCYGYDDDEPIFVIDDGTQVLYHGDSASIPLKEFTVSIISGEKNILNSDYDEYYICFIIGLTINLEECGIYPDDLRDYHVAGMNHLKFEHVSYIDVPMESTINLYFNRDEKMENLSKYADYVYGKLYSYGFKNVDIIEI